jgi:putative SOS response-associated peptidase YedK
MEDLRASQSIKMDASLLMEPGRDVRPSEASAVICNHDNDLTAVSMRWGFSNPYKKGLIINARSETAREKNLFRDSIMTRRCIIPASGFYEWDRYKAKFRFTRPGDGLLLMAGFYREEQSIPRYTILTAEANESMRPVHDRMPVIIGKDEIRSWLTDNEKLSEFLERPQIQLTREQDSGQIRMDFGI